MVSLHPVSRMIHPFRDTLYIDDFIDLTRFIHRKRAGVIFIYKMFTVLQNNSYKVWSQYDAKREDGTVLKLRIQDLSWDRHKSEVLDFFINYYIKDEAFHKTAGIFKSEEAKNEYKELFVQYYEKNPPHVSICCKDEDSKTIDVLGISLICKFQNCASDDDGNGFYENLKTKELKNFFRVLKATPSDNLFESFESYYEGRGISVRPDHRGLGIANEFMRLRKQICIDNNIQMTSAWMTSIGTQKAADKYNWKTFLELNVEDLAKQTGLVIEANVPTFKLMYTTKD